MINRNSWWQQQATRASTALSYVRMCVCALLPHAQVLALGYSVGRVEEMPAGSARTGAGASSSSSKLLVRQLVRIYTPGTAVEGLLLDDQVGAVVC
jgi:hypothetical protein